MSTGQSRINSREAITAFSTVPGEFPPVTFFETGDAIAYAMSFSPAHAASTCPALSFVKYDGDRRG